MQIIQYDQPLPVNSRYNPVPGLTDYDLAALIVNLAPTAFDQLRITIDVFTIPVDRFIGPDRFAGGDPGSEM